MGTEGASEGAIEDEELQEDAVAIVEAVAGTEGEVIEPDLHPTALRRQHRR